MFLHLSVILFTGGGGFLVSVPAGSPSQGGVCLGGVSILGGSLSRGGSLSKGSLCLGGLCHGDPPYGNERAVRILLDAFLFTSMLNLVMTSVAYNELNSVYVLLIVSGTNQSYFSTKGSCHWHQ